MVPEATRILVVRVLVHIRLARQYVVLGLAIETGRQVAAMQVGDNALGIAPVVGAVCTGIDLQQVVAAVTPATCGQVVDVGHLDGLPLDRHNSRGWPGTVVGPHGRIRQLRMNILYRLLHRNGVLRYAIGPGARALQDRRDRQGLDEGCQTTVGLIAVAAHK